MSHDEILKFNNGKKIQHSHREEALWAAFRDLREGHKKITIKDIVREITKMNITSCG